MTATAPRAAAPRCGRRAVAPGLALATGLALAGCMSVSKDAPETTASRPVQLDEGGSPSFGAATTGAAAGQERPAGAATPLPGATHPEIPTEPTPAPAPAPALTAEPIAAGPAGREPVARDPRRGAADGPELLGVDGLFAESVGAGAGSARPPLYVVCLDGERTFAPLAEERVALAHGAGESAWFLHASLEREAGPLDCDRLIDLARAEGAQGLALVRFGGSARARRAAVSLVELDTARAAACALELEPSFEVAGAAIRRHLLGGR